MSVRTAKRKEPEVIVFVEPSYSHRTTKEAVKEKDRFLRGDVSEIFNCLPSRPVKTTAEPSTSQFDLKETLREVQSLAASSFTGKTKRQFEEEQIQALGAKPPPKEYVPYPHYQAMAKAKREKEKRHAEELKLTQKKKRRQGKREVSVKGRSRWKDSTKSLEPGLGKFKNGVLTLSKRDLAKVK